MGSTIEMACTTYLAALKRADDELRAYVCKFFECRSLFVDSDGEVETSLRLPNKRASNENAPGPRTAADRLDNTITMMVAFGVLPDCAT